MFDRKTTRSCRRSLVRASTTSAVLASSSQALRPDLSLDIERRLLAKKRSLAASRLWDGPQITNEKERGTNDPCRNSSRRYRAVLCARRPRFFSIGDNSFSKRGFPWIQRLGAGFRQVYLCNRCASGRSIWYGDGPVEAFLESCKGVKWPDALGCGHFPFLVLSERAVRAFRDEGLGDIQAPLPMRLAGSEPPRYVWLDGEKMRGASLDFEASGLLNVRFCPECGTRTDNISATFHRQNSGDCPYAFRPRAGMAPTSLPPIFPLARFSVPRRLWIARASISSRIFASCLPRTAGIPAAGALITCECALRPLRVRERGVTRIRGLRAADHTDGADRYYEPRITRMTQIATRAADHADDTDSQTRATDTRMTQIRYHEPGSQG